MIEGRKQDAEEGRGWGKVIERNTNGVKDYYVDPWPWRKTNPWKKRWECICENCMIPLTGYMELLWWGIQRARVIAFFLCKSSRRQGDGFQPPSPSRAVQVL